LSQTRAEALAELSAAEAEHDQARRVWVEIEHRWRAEEEKLHAISKARPPLVRGVLIEVAQAATERRRAAFRELANAGSIIEGVQGALRRAGDDAGQVAITEITRGGSRVLDNGWHDDNIRRSWVLRDAWAEIYPALMRDSGATIDEDEPAHLSNDGAAA
jgi:hypothetical protein